MEQNESIIDVQNSPEIQTNNTSDSVDRISALPDPILGVILSSLPIKNAVSTAFLSKRWKFVWLTVDSLDFYHEGCSKELAEGEDLKFIQFVNRVLHLHGVGSLNTFRLVSNPWHISSSHVSSWINTAITRNIHELSLFVETPNGPFEIPDLFVMPVSVFSCGSLQSMQLNGGISVSETIVVCLPKLESLKLNSVFFESEEAFEKLISGCPMLNYLHLHTDFDSIGKYFFEDDDDFTYRISSTSLTRLEFCFKKDIPLDYEDFDCNLKLDAPSLEYLKLGGDIHKIFVPKSLTSLIVADFRPELPFELLISYDICDSIVEAVRAFDCAKTLTLSEDAVSALSSGSIRLTTKFKRLVKLETSMECCHWRSLQEVIQSSDSLQVLTIHQNPNYWNDLSDHNHTNWPALVVVPRCLSNSLKKVVINSYFGYVDENEMIRYLLKHGSVLESMKIYCGQYRLKEEFLLLQELCKFPRNSPDCVFEFIEWND